MACYVYAVFSGIGYSNEATWASLGVKLIINAQRTSLKWEPATVIVSQSKGQLRETAVPVRHRRLHGKVACNATINELQRQTVALKG